MIYLDSSVCGVDEAGRGPLAGPVYAAAVVLPEGIEIAGLNDSKKLSEKKREELFVLIKEIAVSYSISFAEVNEIEELNILGATILAMNRAISGISPQPEKCLIDGNRNKGINFISEPVVKGDSKYACIAAASILAKVSRDHYMYEMAEKYPLYGFDKHKGYGTAEHYEAIKKYGLSEIHRPSFFKKKNRYLL